MKANVEKGICVGCGLCTELCPDVFRIDEDGLAIAEDKDISGTDLECAKDTAHKCPVNAINIE